MITIVDYGLGNAQAFANIYKRLEIQVTFAKTADDLAEATHIILPGVGAFDWAMERLEASGMRATLDRLVLQDRRQVLGICVGMQIMARHSDEGSAVGLGWFNAEVKRFDEACVQGQTRLPHMGWNDVHPHDTLDLFREMSADARFYFLHSYYFAPKDPTDVLAQAVYGGRFTCAVRRQNIYGVQFHPEKSHGWGIQLLKNFARL
jgi:glutamine amidotransferase